MNVWIVIGIIAAGIAVICAMAYTAGREADERLDELFGSMRSYHDDDVDVDLPPKRWPDPSSYELRDDK